VTFGVALIGAGIISKRLASVFDSNNDITVKGFYDVNRSQADLLIESFSGKNYNSFEEVLNDQEVDIVYVGVPPKYHHEYTIDALKAKKHVICEKPIAISVKEADEMVEVANNLGLITTINLPFRFSPAFKAIKTNLHRIGTIKKLELKFRFPQWPRTWQDVDWLKYNEQGGALREVGTHYLFGLGELSEFIGKPTEVRSYVNFQDNLAESNLTGIILFDSMLTCYVDLLTNTSENEENTLIIYGEKGILRFESWSTLKFSTDGK
jgi:predicted dehydrogenase